MKLRALEAQFLRWESKVETREFVNDPAVGIASGTHEVTGPVDYFHPVGTLAEAHGICFLCPLSYQRQGGPVGAHTVQVFFCGSPVPPHLGLNSDNQPVRWTPAGSGLDDLTLSPSIAEQDNSCKWHGHVSNGDAA